MTAPGLAQKATQLGAPAKRLHFVVKTSKYCNLRCTYCYEYAFLDDRRRMSTDQIATLFRGIAAYAEAEGIDDVGFTWHGGEPLLVPLDVYEEIDALQRTLLANVKVTNTAQTNLTILTERHLDYLKTGRFFGSIGISFDVAGDKRVDKKGRPTTATVLANLQRIIDAEIPFGTICVLARSNVGRIGNVFRFFDELQVACRFLPFYGSTDGTGDDAETVTQAEIVAALAELFDDWMQSPNPIAVQPLADLIDIANSVIRDAPREVYDKAEREWVYVVNPNGDLWGISEIEDNRFLYGNLFDTPLEDILASDARRSTFAAARGQIDRICGQCPYLGHCPGYFAADATEGVLGMLEREGCHIKGLLDHIVGRLEANGLSDVIRHGGAILAESRAPAAC